MLVRTAVRPSHGSVLILHPGFLFSGLVEGEPSTVFLLLCLPSGCGLPLGSLVSVVTIDRHRRRPLEGLFFCVVASHLFRQNTYLQNKKHTLTCQVGLVVTDLITSPVVSWEGWETPPPPAPRLCCHSLLNHRRGKTSLLLW